MEENKSPDTTLAFGSENNLDFDKYKKYVMSGFGENATGTPVDKAHAALGAVTELGECCDWVKKDVFHGKIIDKIKLTEEFGDALFYIAALLDLYGITMADILAANKAKLDYRYKNGRQDLIFRDTKMEYKIISDAVSKAKDNLTDIT